MQRALRRLRCGIGCELLALIAAGCASSEPIEDGRSAAPPVRVIAEWEPALGAIVSWPLSVPDALVAEIAEDGLLFVTVTSAESEAARAHLTGLGIDAARLRLVEGPATSLWPRDWGPHQVFDGAGRFGLVDARFAGYPRYAAEPELLASEDGPRFFPGYRGDDGAPERLAALLDQPLYSLPLFLTGGNFLVDGRGGAFCTQAQILENRGLASEVELRRRLQSDLGIERLVVLENTEGMGIQHIDCWLKLLDEETLLVKRPPADHPEAARIERNLAAIAASRTAWGRPWRILRIDCPPFAARRFDPAEPPLAAYTNALILGRKVLVPLYDIPGDEAALETWRAALPGYEVLGFPWPEWQSFDALHCRVRAVFDPHMLRLSHPRLPAAVPNTTRGYPVLVEIDDRSGAGLVASGLAVHYRRAGEAAWSSVPLDPVGAGHAFAAFIPACGPGARVEYWIRAEDRSGRVATSPPAAPAGFHGFDVVAAEP
jgi:agmatine deiminase